MISGQIDSLKRHLRLIRDTGCEANVLLIGSWAEFAYMESGLLPNFLPDIRTQDVDLSCSTKMLL